MSKTIFIGGRLESKEKGNVVAGANAILDDTKGKKQNVINKETDDELLRLEQSKQDNLTFDNSPTEDSTNPVTSGGVYTAEKALSDAIEAILLLIPSAATALNKLVDTNTMNSSISTATATFRGTYNAVSDLGLTYQATHAQIEAALDALGLTADNNDYAFVQVPVSDQSQDIAKTERYKNNGTNWQYEYDLNTSGFTAAQWGAINSTITLALVQKLAALPTNAELLQALGLKQDVLTFDNAPTTDSNNPVKSGGIKNAIDTAVGDEATARENADTALGGLIGDEHTRAEGVEGGLNTRLGAVEGSVSTIQGVIPSGAASNNKLVDNDSMTTYIGTIIDNIDATFNVTSTDGHVTLAITQVNGVITSVQLTTSDIASAAALNLKASQADLTALAGRVTTAEGNITSLTGRVSTNEGNITFLTGRVSTNETDIANLQQLYNNLQQSKPVPVTSLPSSGQQQGVIYRLAGTTSYSDYMWNGSTWVLMATYNNAIDAVPTEGSHNLVESGGVNEAIGGVESSIVNKTLTLSDFSVSDKYIDSNGVAQGNGLWISTPYIKVKENTTIEVNLSEGNSVVYVAFYSGEGTQYFISSWYGNRGNMQSFTVPAGCMYFRASTQPSYSSTYVSYKDDEYVSKDILILKNSVGKLDIIDGITPKQYGTEIFTNNNGYINDNGTVDAHGDWKYSDFLPILGGTQMTARLADGNGFVAIAFYYDKSTSAFISSTQDANGREELPPAVIDVPQSATYFRAANKNSYTDAYILAFLSAKQIALAEYNYNEIETLKQQISDIEEKVTKSDIPDFHLAKKIYCVKNDTNLLFVRGIVHAVNPYLYSRKCVSSDIPAANVSLFPRYLKVLFDSVVTKNINFSLIDNKYNESTVKQSQIIVKEPQTPDSNINIVCLGSSTTNDGVWAGELKRRLTKNGGTPAGDNLSNITFVGRMHGSYNTDVQVEATGGWNWNSFINGAGAIELTVSGVTNISNGDRYYYTNEHGNAQSVLYIQESDLSGGSGKIVVAPLGGNPISQSGTLTKLSGNGDDTISFSAYDSITWSPFIQNGVFGFTNYANRYCNGSIDVMICHLSYLNMNLGGANNMTTVMQKVKTFIDKLHTDFPNCKVLITTCIGASPNGGASEYGTRESADPEKVYTDYGLLFGEWEFQNSIEEFVADDNYKNFCFMANTLEEVDMENAFPTGNIPLNLRTSGEETIQTNALHPTLNGSYMTADSIYRCFVCTCLN